MLKLLYFINKIKSYIVCKMVSDTINIQGIYFVEFNRKVKKKKSPN